MSVNTAHASRGVLIHTGENILLHCKNVEIQFPGQLNQIFIGTKPGYLYLTSHRMIFRSKRQTEVLRSLSAPFIAIDDILVDKQSFPSPICGKFRAQPNGNFKGQIEFKLFFKSNEAAVEFVDALFCAITMTIHSNINLYLLPHYKPPRVWYEAPLELHKCPSIFKAWFSTTNDLFQSPSLTSVFMCDTYPPFPGIDINKKSILNCNLKFKVPCKDLKIPTPTESFDGFIRPPKYGLVKTTYKEGNVFPHQAANLLLIQNKSELPAQLQDATLFDVNDQIEKSAEKNE